MKPILTPPTSLIAVPGNRVWPSPSDDIGGEILEARSGEGLDRAGLAVGVLLAAALLHALQFGRALVEFMIADRGKLEPGQAQRLDRRLVEEQRRRNRAGADQVPRGDRHAVGGPHLLQRARRDRPRRPPALAPSAAGTVRFGGSRLPWKSLMARICTSTGPCELGAGRALSRKRQERQWQQKREPASIQVPSLRSEAKQSRLDCRVAALFAMTQGLSSALAPLKDKTMTDEELIAAARDSRA